MWKTLSLALLLASPAWTQARHTPTPLTHLGVPAASLVTVDLRTRADLSTGAVAVVHGYYL